MSAVCWELRQYFPYVICQCVIGCAVIVLYLPLVKSCVQSNFHAIFQKFCIVSVGVGMVSITTFKVKFKCCKSQVFCFWQFKFCHNIKSVKGMRKYSLILKIYSITKVQNILFNLGRYLWQRCHTQI